MGITQDNLAAYVTSYLATKEIVKTSLRSTARLDGLMDKKKSRGGSNFEFGVRNENSAKGGKYFLPDDATTDFVGSTPGANNYTRIDPVVNGKASWSFLLEEFKYSKVQLQQYSSAGKAQLNDYLASRIDFAADNMADTTAYNALFGRGNGNQGTLPSVTGSIASEPYGLHYQERYYSGTAGANTNNQSDNTHFGLARHLHPALVSNVFDATAHYGATVTELAKTLTNGNTEIPGLTSVDYTPYLGWEIWYRSAGVGSYKRMGGEYVVADVTAGAATKLQMSQIFRGTTGSYDIQLRAPYNTTTHGAAGAWTLPKLNTAYSAASGAKGMGLAAPNLISCNQRTFNGFMNYLQEIKRWVEAKDATLESRGFDHFKFHTANVVVDPYEDDGVVRFENMNYVDMYALNGMDSFKVNKSDIVLASSEAGVLQYVCPAVFVSQIVNRSPRSCAVVSGLNV